MTTTREKLRQMVIDRPDMDQSELALALGVSRQRIGQLVHDEEDPINVAAYNNHRAQSMQNLAASLVTKVQEVLRRAEAGGPEVYRWKDISAEAKVTRDVGTILRDRVPMFYHIVEAHMAAARDARKAAKRAAKTP